MNEIKRNNNIPLKKILETILNSFSKKQTIVFAILLLTIIVTTVSILGKINKKFLIYLPERGGTLTEGVIGTPRFINPILSLSETDRDLSSLIYSGLMKKTPNGDVLTDLAENYTISPDGLTYTFKIKNEAIFHDKKTVTAQDVIFTVEKIKDSTIKSPIQAIWQGVFVEQGEDLKTVVFKLNQPYAAFLDNVTIGILPKHIWENLDSEEFNLSEYNIKSIGSGPYKIKDVKEKKNGLIEEIEVISFNQYYNQKPFIKKIRFEFFKNESDLIKSYRKGRVDQISSINPRIAKNLLEDGYKPTTATLSRVFGLFLNPNQNEILRDKDVIKAFDLAINRNALIENVLFGFGEPIDGPVPRSLLNEENLQEDVAIPSYEENKSSAETILENKGWKKDESGFRAKEGKKLEISISTADVEDLKLSAEQVKKDLESIGVKVNVKIFEVGVLNQNIIRPREYEILLFGQVIRNESDLFAFWHSSQRNDPGLNISVYTNSKADKILEDLVETTEADTRETKLQELSTLLKEDRPAIFLYSPEFIYMESEKIKNVELDHITSSSDRFLGVRDWYIRTDAVWKFWP